MEANKEEEREGNKEEEVEEPGKGKGGEVGDDDDDGKGNVEKGKQQAREKPQEKELSHSQEKAKKQIEFYFGDANLKRDKWLQNKIRESPGKWVTLDTLLTFNRLKRITTDKQLILDALETSSLLKVDRENEQVRRKVPLAKGGPRDVDCTVFASGIPLDASLDEIEECFHNAVGDDKRVKLIRMRHGFVRNNASTATTSSNSSISPASSSSSSSATTNNTTTTTTNSISINSSNNTLDATPQAATTTTSHTTDTNDTNDTTDQDDEDQRGAEAFMAGRDEEDDADNQKDMGSGQGGKQQHSQHPNPRNRAPFNGTVFVLLESPKDVHDLVRHASENSTGESSMKIRGQPLTNVQPMKDWLKGIRQRKRAVAAASTPTSSMKRKARNISGNDDGDDDGDGKGDGDDNGNGGNEGDDGDGAGDADGTKGSTANAGSSGATPFNVDVESGCIVAVDGLGEGCERETFKDLLDENIFGLQFVDYSRGEANAKLRFDTPEGAKKASEKLQDAETEIAGSKPEKVYILEGEDEQAYLKKVQERKDARKGRPNKRGGGRGGGGGHRNRGKRARTRR